MTDEILKRDQNRVTVLGGITDDADQDIVMFRVDPITKRLLVSASISGGVITSVSNSDGTLTISPTTGAVVASLNTSHANTWGALQTFGNNISFGGATLNVSSLTSGDILRYNGTNWVNTAQSSLAVTLAQVSSSSTDATKSIYSMTEDVDTHFRWFSGNAGLYFDESTERIGLNSSSPNEAVQINGGLRISSSDGTRPYTTWYQGTTSPYDGTAYVNNSTSDNKYIVSASAFGFNISDGKMTFLTAASGTAGNTISWTERVRITNDGYVGIGTNSPTSILTVNGELDLTSSSSVGFARFDTPGTQYLRIGGLPAIADWGGFFLNASFNGSGWDLDDTADNGWFFKLDTRGGNSISVNNGLWLFNVPPGEGTHTDEFAVFGVSNGAAHFKDKLGIGTVAGIGTLTTLNAKFNVLSTTEQMRLMYDASNYLSATVSSTGGVTFDANGSGASFTFSDVVTVNGGSGTIPLTVNRTGIGVLLRLESTSGSDNVGFIEYRGNGSRKAFLGFGGSGLVNNNFSINNNTTNGGIILATNNTARMTVEAGGDIGFGIENPTSPFHFQSNTTDALLLSDGDGNLLKLNANYTGAGSSATDILTVFRSGIRDIRLQMINSGFRMWDQGGSTYATLQVGTITTGTFSSQQSIYGGATTYERFRYTAGNDYFQYYTDDGVAFRGGFGWASGSGDWQFRVNGSNSISAGTQALVLKSTGDVYTINDFGVGPTSNDASAKFQVDSTTQGFLPPRMTGAQGEAISSPATGLLIYATSAGSGDITAAGWWGWNGANWVAL